MGCSPDTMWLSAYLPVAWAGHICLGLAMGILGPTQPYLARQVGVPNQQINFIWTGRALGTCIAAVITSLVFRLFIRKSWQKLTFLATALLGTGLFILLVPWLHSFWLLLPSLLMAGFCLGCFDAADNSLFVYMLGPARSKPFIQSLHAAVALGFTLGSLIVHPFLPSAESSPEVCDSPPPVLLPHNHTHTPPIVSDSEVDVQSNLHWPAAIPDLAWPFIIIAFGHLLTFLAFVILAILGLPMPHYYDPVVQNEVEVRETDRKTGLRHPTLVLGLSFFFFAFTCGLEGFFQSQTYTFALCGPHQFSPSDAATLTTIYFSSFLTGRFSGILLSTRLSTHSLILTSQLGCIISSLLLAFTAGWVPETLYFGTAAMGFSVSLQFASGYSWLAEQVDLTGSRGSVVFLGANLGWLVFPPLAGLLLFSGPGGVGLYLLSLGITIAHLVLFLAMIKTATLKN